MKIISKFIVMGFLMIAFFISGCGGSDSGGAGSGTLSNPPAGYKFTDANGNTVTSWDGTTTIQLRDDAGNILFAFTPSGDVDFSNVSVARSATVGLVHFPSDTDKAGITGEVTLYVPCISNENSIIVCPDATTEAEVVAGCANGQTLTPVAPTAGSYTYANAATRTGVTDCMITADIANFGTGGVGDVVLPSLAADDLPTTAPCGANGQDLLTDPTFIADLSTTTNDFRMFYDAAPNYCGFGSQFAADHTNIAFVANDSGTCSNWANLYAAPASGGTGIGFCGDDPNTNSLPKAGVYRHDFQAENEGRTYQYRVRATVTAGAPDVTGKTYTEVFGTENIASLIEYVDPAGNVITQDCSVQATAGSYLPYPMTNFTVRKVSDGTALFTVQVEVICAEQI